MTMVRNGLRSLLRLIQTCLIAASITFWVLTLRPQVLGGPAAYLVIRGDSMLPTYETGDLLILHSADAYGIGDVVAYKVPAGELGEGHLIVHRIVDGDGSTGWILEGDNNPAPDPWTPRDGDIVGRPWVAMPQAGRLLVWLHQPVMLAGLAAALVVALIIAHQGPWTPPLRPRVPGRSPAT